MDAGHGWGTHQNGVAGRQDVDAGPGTHTGEVGIDGLSAVQQLADSSGAGSGTTHEGRSTDAPRRDAAPGSRQ